MQGVGHLQYVQDLSPHILEVSIPLLQVVVGRLVIRDDAAFPEELAFSSHKF